MSTGPQNAVEIEVYGEKKNQDNLHSRSNLKTKFMYFTWKFHKKVFVFLSH